MSSTLKNVAIIGASGSIGRLVLAGLLRAPQLNVTIIVRTSSKATFPVGPTIRKSDFSEQDLSAAFKGQDAVISVVGAGVFLDQKKYIDAAVSAGVKRFFPSEFSVNTLAPGVQELLPVFGEKKEVLDYLKSKESSGLTWTAIWTAPLSDWGLSNGFLEYDIKARIVTIWDDGDKSFTLTSEKQLGAAVTAALDRPAQTTNKNLYVASLETTQNEILAAFEHATGTKWTTKSVKSKDQIKQAQAQLESGDFGGLYTLVRATSYSDHPNLRANYVKDEILSNELLGLAFETIEDTVSSAITSAA